ncbi:4-hydroxy-3-methylbut-2-enyl diphosphatereductase, partial [Striga asiatica]
KQISVLGAPPLHLPLRLASLLRPWIGSVMGGLLLRAPPSGRGWFRRQQRVCISAPAESPPTSPSLRDRLPLRLPSLAAGNVCRLQHINENSPRFVAKLIAKVEKTGACAGVINEEKTSVARK